MHYSAATSRSLISCSLACGLPRVSCFQSITYWTKRSFELYWQHRDGSVKSVFRRAFMTGHQSNLRASRQYRIYARTVGCMASSQEKTTLASAQEVEMMKKLHMAKQFERFIYISDMWVTKPRLLKLCIRVSEGQPRHLIQEMGCRSACSCGSIQLHWQQDHFV